MHASAHTDLSEVGCPVGKLQGVEWHTAEKQGLRGLGSQASGGGGLYPEGVGGDMG